MDQQSDFENSKKYLGFILDIRRKFLDKHKEEVKDLIQYAIALMSILGLIAGFGFTAFQFVASLKLFFLGEGLVLGSILYLIFRTRRHLTSQPLDTEKYINDSMDKALEIKTALIKGDQMKIKELGEEFMGSIHDVSETPKLITAVVINNILRNALWASSLGIIAIFSSFLICF